MSADRPYVLTTLNRMMVVTTKRHLLKVEDVNEKDAQLFPTPESAREFAAQLGIRTPLIAEKFSTLFPEKTKLTLPKPGSDAAIAQGCLCPVLDNAHGIGYMGVPGRWVMVENCPLHGFSTGVEG